MSRLAMTVSVADTAPRRMRGLLGRSSLDPDDGLLLRPAGSVHTAFMRFPIDVVFLGPDDEVLDVRPEVPPWRAVARRGAKAVLELAAGQAARRGIAPGIRLELDRRAPEEKATAAAAAADDSADALPEDATAGPAPAAYAELRTPALIAAGIGAVLALVRFGFGSTGVVTACFLAALGALAVIDFRTKTLPNRILLPATLIVYALQMALFTDQALEWTLAALGCFVVLLILALIKPGGIGMGDVKLGLLLGAGLGLQAATALLIGFVALWPVALWILLRDGRDARTQTLPLGPALAFGAAVVALVG